MFTRFFLALINVLLFLNLNAQDYAYFELETGDEFAITPETSDSIIELYLEANNLKDIEFNSNESSVYSFRVLTKKGNWRLFNYRHSEFMGWEGMSIEFPSNELERLGITIASDKKKKHFYSLDEQYLLDYKGFYEIKPFELEAITYVTNSETGEKEKTKVTKHIFALKRKKKWGVAAFSISYFEDFIQTLAPYGYESIDDLPIDELISLYKSLEFDYKNRIENPLKYFYEAYTLEDYERIEFNPNRDSYYPCRLQDKKGDWYLADREFMMYGEKGFSLSFPISSCANIAEASKKDKKFIYLLGEDGNYLVEDFEFDELKQNYSWNKKIKMNYEGEHELNSDDSPIHDSVGICNGLLVRRGSKWALAHWSYQSYEFNQLSGFHFDSSNEVPDTLLRHYLTTDDGVDPVYDDYLMRVTHDFLQNYQEADLVTVLGPYQYDQQILKMRHSETKRWSMVIPGVFNESTDLPIAASKIKEHFFDENKQVLEVWCDDKVGYYFYNGEDIKLIKDCGYEDFEYLFLDATYGCALKKNGKWELYKVDASEKLVDGSAASIESLTELWLNR